MNLFPLRAEGAQQWLKKAADDLESARTLTATDQHGNAAFFCQQAAEKAIKAFLTWHDIRFPKTHLLEDLAKLVAPVEQELALVIAKAKNLTEYAWEFRYPGATKEATAPLVKEALALAESVYQAVLARVPKEAHPAHGDHK